MNSQEAIAILVQHRDDLRARGVRHAALFGSVARGEASQASDLDILIELDPAATFDDLATIKTRLDRVERSIDQRFDQVDKKFDQLDKKLDGLTRSLPSIVGEVMREVLRERDDR